MNTRLLLVAAALLVGLGIVGGGGLFFLLRASSNRPKSTPLVSANKGKPPAPLPKDAIVLTASDGAEVEAPFLIHDEAGAVGGIAAFQPKGSRTEEHKGRIKFTAQVPEAGSYNAWVHGKWRDSCSNSCALKAGSGADATAGNDDVFNVWHWVPAGKHTLTQGANPVAIVEREDGIYLDQILLTKDANYVPTGAISTAGVLRDIRRFADTFQRSPGHGNEGWEFEGTGKFDIAFSFDPNRIPNQYALSGDAKTGPCFAFVKGAPWYGCKISYSFLPASEGKYGCVFDKNGEAGFAAGFEIKNGKAAPFVGTSTPKESDFQEKKWQRTQLRMNQWHRVEIEHWAWITRIWLDGKEVYSSDAHLAKAGKSGLFVESGSAVFDDFEIEEIPWMADDGRDFKIEWTQSEDAKWFRKDLATCSVLTGEKGEIKAGLGGIPLEEIVFDKAVNGTQDIPVTEPAANYYFDDFKVKSPGLVEVRSDPLTRILRIAPAAEGSGTHATFIAEKPRTGFRRVALRFGRHTPPVFNIGPYTFAQSEMEDPSDYLDFTEAEYREMARSPEAAKLKRHAKIKSVIGHADDEETAPWLYMGGSWTIDTREGCVKGRGSNSMLRHAQEIANDMEMRFNIRLGDANTTAEIELYSGGDSSLRVQLAPEKKTVPLPAGVAMNLDVQADKQWHEVALRVEGTRLSAKIDRAPLKEATFKRGDGDRVFLKIARGSVDFDDVEFIVQRESSKGVLYAFNQPEPDWIGEPADNWVDHGGIACVLASSWISLVAADGKGMMWNKRTFSSNALVTFNIEENSEWYGWDKYPNHTHFPFDHVQAVLANEKDPAINYTLEFNAENHSHTILYRSGKEVARIRQDRSYPMHFIGSHMPFLPRTNRVCLIKRDGFLRGLVNGKEVIKFSDPQPLDVSKVGLGGHNTRVNFSHIEIRDLSQEKEKPAKDSKEVSSAAKPDSAAAKN